jgi:hypothetical protein
VNPAEQDTEIKMRQAIRVWLRAPAGKRPSPQALGAYIANLAAQLDRRRLIPSWLHRDPSPAGHHAGGFFVSSARRVTPSLLRVAKGNQ